MPRGASPRREAEARKLERKFKKEKRYQGREEEVAARIVNKQRAAAGETKSAHRPAHRTTARRKHRTRSGTRNTGRSRSSS